MDEVTSSEASKGIVLGVFFQLLGWFIRTHTMVKLIDISGVVALVAGTLIFIRGCQLFAAGRGLHNGMGLLGLLSLPGLGALWLLSRKQTKA